jgi:hypothetical protein
MQLAPIPAPVEAQPNPNETLSLVSNKFSSPLTASKPQAHHALHFAGSHIPQSTQRFLKDHAEPITQTKQRQHPVSFEA